MNAIWNLSILARPPYATWQIKPLDAKKREICKKTDRKLKSQIETRDKERIFLKLIYLLLNTRLLSIAACKSVDINQFKALLTTAIHDLESMSDLHVNAAVLSRLIYRMKSKFRNDKGLKYMIKLNKALLNYHNMSLKKEYTTLRSNLRIEDGMYVLPSRQSLEYVLVRTQGFGKLMARIEEISKCSSHLLKARINVGHAWNVALIAYATTSRIWFYTRNVMSKCCKWYDELYQCAVQFRYVGAKSWFPTNQSLPRDLKSWLCLDWLDVNTIDNHKLQIWQKIFGESSTKELNDIETTLIIPNEDIDGSRLVQEIASTNYVLEDRPVLNTDINDIGEVIDREVFKRSLPSNDRSVMIKRKQSDINKSKSLREPKRKRKKYIR